MSYSTILGREIQGSNWARNHLGASDSSIDERKSISYLKKLFNKLKDKENVNIKDIEKTFKKQLQKDTNLSLEEIDLQLSELSSSGIFEELENALKETQDETSDSTSENDALFEMYELMFQEEEFIKIGDLDESGDLSAQEMEEMILSISNLDGNGENTTLDELLYATKGILEGKSLEEITNEADSQLITDPTTGETKETLGSTSGSKLATQNTHASNYSTPSGDLASHALNDKNNEESIPNQIAQIDKEIQEKTAKKVQIMADTSYETMINELNTLQQEAISKENSIADFKTTLHEQQYDLIASETQLKEMEANPPQILKDRQTQNGQTYQQEYEATINKLKQDIQTKTQEVTATQSKIETAEKELETINQNKQSKETEIQEFESQHPNNEIDTINSEIKELETKKQELQKQLEEQRKQELSDAEVYGKAQAYRQSEFVKCMMDFATNPKTKEQYDKWYYEKFNGKAYCAVFSKDVAMYMYKEVAAAMGIDEADLETMYQAADKTCPKTRGVGSLNFASSVAGTYSWGEEMQAALDQYGIGVNATIDISKMSEQERKDAVRNGKIYPGMAFTYMENGRLHIGYVESINKDLSWNTIEGNTSIKYSDGASEDHTVGAHKRDATFGDLTGMTDPTVKVLWWIKYMQTHNKEYSEVDINNYIY